MTILFLHSGEHALNPAGWTLTMVGLALAMQGLALGAAGLMRLWWTHLDGGSPATPNVMPKEAGTGAKPMERTRGRS